MNILKSLVLLAALLPVCVNALPITDFVKVGDKQWAQVDLFRDVTWNEVSVACPSGVCVSGNSINGWSVSGWTWASNSEVGDNLFAPLTSHTGGVSRSTDIGVDTVSPWLEKTGFRGTGDTTTNSTVDAISLIFGLTRDDLSGQFGGASAAQYLKRGDIYEGSTWATEGRGVAKRIGREQIGVWFYRDVVAVNEPSALSILLPSAILVCLCGRKKHITSKGYGSLRSRSFGRYV